MSILIDTTATPMESSHVSKVSIESDKLNNETDLKNPSVHEVEIEEENPDDWMNELNDNNLDLSSSSEEDEDEEDEDENSASSSSEAEDENNAASSMGFTENNMEASSSSSSVHSSPEKVSASSSEVAPSVTTTVTADGLVLDLYENGGMDRLKATEHLEPLLMENPDRYVMFPIQHKDVWECYQDAKSIDWREDEIDLTYDAMDWKALDAKEKHFISMILGFFAASDGIIIENLAQRFLNEVQWPEARAFYAMQIKIETTHSIVYSELIDTFLKDKEKSKLFKSVENFPCIRVKRNWAHRWITDERASFARRLAAFAAVEGIQFAGSFAAIWWLKKKNKFPGLCYSNGLISRDEGKHTDFATLLYSKLKFKLSQEEIEQVIRGAVVTEKMFICDALPCSLIGMNKEEMSQYIEFVADRLMKQLGYKPIYNVINPFKWMENIGQLTRTNFFEKRVLEYEVAQHDKKMKKRDEKGSKDKSKGKNKKNKTNESIIDESKTNKTLDIANDENSISKDMIARMTCMLVNGQEECQLCSS